MKGLFITGYKVGEGCYMKNGVPETNFTIDRVKLVKESMDMVKYRIHLNINGRGYLLEVSPKEINRRRFLKELSVIIKNERDFYNQLRNAIFSYTFEEGEIVYQTGRNGLQEVNGERVFVFTNGAITKEGFKPEIYSGIDGFYLPEAALADLKGNKEALNALLEQYHCVSRVFYPLFLINITAITNGYFRLIGENGFMKLTLWLNGVSGSGKTELAKAVGNYVFHDKDLSKDLISVTGSRRYTIRRLPELSGGVIIMDDLKCERTRERKNSTKNITDDVLRSIFQGRVTDSLNADSNPEWIDCCAVITGEYLDTDESQNARMLYLKVDDFLKEEKNSRALRKLQENPLWLTTVCAGYIRWLLEMMEEDSFGAWIKERLQNMREEKQYKGISNSERLNESCRMMEMAAVLLESYFRNSINMPEDFITRFHKDAEKSIQDIGDATFELLGGEKAVILKIMKNILSDSGIRKAKYQEYNFISKWKYRQEYFWIRAEEDFVWIENYKKSMQKEEESRYERYGEKPCLLIREERLYELIQKEFQRLLKEKQISSSIADKLRSRLALWKLLRKEQIIFMQYRSDNDWGRPAKKYPVYKYYTVQDSSGYYEGDDKLVACEVKCEPVIQMNTEHECFCELEERCDDIDEEDIFANVRNPEIDGMRKEDIYKTRKSFLNSKVLYER